MVNRPMIHYVTLVILLLVYLQTVQAVPSQKIIFNDSRVPGGGNASVITLGDLDGDGYLDMVTGSEIGQSIIAYKNNKTGVSTTKMFEARGNISTRAKALADIDGDGDLDMVAAGSNTAITTIFENIGKSFLSQSINAGGHSDAGSMAFGDVDNDGDLDMAVAYDSNKVTESIVIFENNGTRITGSILKIITRNGGTISDIKLVDVDNDGDLDLAVIDNGGATIYENNGTGITDSLLFNISTKNGADITFGDIDNDGDQDLALAFKLEETALFDVYNVNITIVPNINGYSMQNAYKVSNDMFKGNFFETPDIRNLAFADVDNDGDLDLGFAITRLQHRAIILENNGTTISNNTVFAENITQSNPSATVSTSIGDFDKDGDLEFAVGGVTIPSETIVYDGNDAEMGKPNKIPLPPTMLNNQLLLPRINPGVNLSWNDGSDVETPKQALFYNVRVGTCSGCNNIVSGVYGESQENWYWGNGRQVKYRVIRNLKPGRYYWSV